MKKHQLINQTSGAYEYYTPQEIIEAARRVLGYFDLDPASSVAANKRIGAKQFYTESDDGLSKPWFGKIWMNHPFGKKSNPRWIGKLVASNQNGFVPEALCLTYACTSEKWFQPLLFRPQCFLCPRTNFILPDGKVKKGVTKGSVVTYFGDNTAAFCKEFTPLGVVKLAVVA